MEALLAIAAEFLWLPLETQASWEPAGAACAAQGCLPLLCSALLSCAQKCLSRDRGQEQLSTELLLIP